MICDILAIDNIELVNPIVNYIFKPRFKGTSRNQAPSFDYLEDFDLIFACFKRHYGIDLIDTDLDWWKFTAMLDDIMNTDTSLSKRIETRTTKIPKVDKHNQDYVNGLRDAQLKYRLKGSNKNNTQQNLKGLFDFLKSKAKEG